ncbi:ABC transporter substrate-binding protein [Xanthobacter oligotrophicus]|uniref:ABC transporter substrate-binding protein n=1 Tax=Xanthobacter oligotrophicus TaxID=2607286 RepID=A0ABW6ZWZ3_9HYPH
MSTVSSRPIRVSRRRVLGVALASAFAGSLAAPLSSATAAEPVDLSGVTLRIGIFEDVTRDAIEATDFLKGTPYKIQWARLNGAGPTVQALGGNAIDISWGLSDTAPAKASAEDRQNWTAQNAPIKVIALLKPLDEEKFSNSLIAAHKNAGIKTLADLKGKTYAYNEGGNINALALLGLHAAGLTTKDVQVRLLTYDATSTALIAGAVNAAPVTRARVADALADGTLVEIARDIDVGFPGYVSVTGRTAAIEDPKLGAAIGDFLNRLAKYLRWASARPEDVAKSYVKTQQLSQKDALNAARAKAVTLIPVNPGSPGFDKEIVATGKLVTAGFYPRPVDFATVVDGRFAEQIVSGDKVPTN